MAYTGIDKEIYDSGTHFRPLQEYTQQQWTPPAIMGQNTNAGIVNTQAAGSYMGYPSYEAWLLAQGGGRGGGPSPENFQGSSINQNLGPTNITDYESEAYGVGPTWAGSWAKLKDDFSNIPLPGNLLRKGVMKWRENREIKKQEKIAQQKIEREQTIKDYSNWQSPSGRDHAGTGGIGSPESKQGGAPGTEKGEGSWKGAQGGRIGLYGGGDAENYPENESENIFEIMQDQNIPFSEQVEGGPTEEQVAMVIDMDGRGMEIDEISSITQLGKETIMSILGVEMAQGGIARLL